MNCELGDGRGDIVSTAGNRFGASWQGVSRGGGLRYIQEVLCVHTWTGIQGSLLASVEPRGGVGHQKSTYSSHTVAVCRRGGCLLQRVTQPPKAARKNCIALRVSRSHFFFFFFFFFFFLAVDAVMRNRGRQL